MDTPIPATSGKGPVANLALRRAAGEIHADPVQERIVARLQAVYDQLAAMAAHPVKPGLLARLGLGRAAKPPAGPPELVWQSLQPLTPLKAVKIVWIAAP